MSEMRWWQGRLRNILGAGLWRRWDNDSKIAAGDVPEVSAAQRRLIYLCESASDGHTRGVYRPFGLGRLAAEQGWRVTVVSSTVSNQHSEQLRAGARRIGRVGNIRLRGLFAQAQGARRALNMLMFAWLATMLLVRLRLKRRDETVVLITSSTGGIDALVGIIAKHVLGIRWILEVRDIWPDAPMETISSPSRQARIFFALIERLHQIAVRTTDSVLSPLANLPDRYHDIEFLVRKPFYCIPNCYRPYSSTVTPIMGNTPVHEKQLRDLRHFAGRFDRTVGYFGSMNGSNKVERLVQLALSLEGEGVGFVFVGGGESFPDVARLADGCTNLLVQPSVPAFCLQSMISEVDILMFGFPDIPVFRFGLSPLKYPDYLLAGKPIFYWGPPNLDRTCTTGHMVSVESEDIAIARNEMLSLSRRTDEELRKMGKNARAHAGRAYDYGRYRDDFLSLLACTPSGRVHSLVNRGSD